jgi:hypothetical protein
MIRFPIATAERLLRALRLRPHFLAVHVIEAPYEERMDPTLLYREVADNLRCAVFLCPNCGRRILLPLELIKPRWKYTVDLLSRPTLIPSVRHEGSCGAHFSIRRGRIRRMSRKITAPEEICPALDV